MDGIATLLVGGLIGAECPDQCTNPSLEVLESFPLVPESMVLEEPREFRAEGSGHIMSAGVG